MLQNAYFVAKFRFDTADNEPIVKSHRADRKEWCIGALSSAAVFGVVVCFWRAPTHRFFSNGIELLIYQYPIFRPNSACTNIEMESRNIEERPQEKIWLPRSKGAVHAWASPWRSDGGLALGEGAAAPGLVDYTTTRSQLQDGTTLNLWFVYENYSKYSLESSSRDVHIFAPLRPKNFRQKPSTFCAND